MSRKIITLAAFLIFLAACSDRPAVTPPASPASTEPQAPPAPDAADEAASAAARAEQLARLVARALGDPEFRSSLKAELDGSPYREHKLHFQRLLDAAGGRAAAAIARANAVPEADVRRAADAAMALEIYLPVAAHREAWAGDDRVLVATALHDRDAPVAFDPAGARFVLSPDQPPETPVIALVPVETNFDAFPMRADCLEGCGGGGGGGGSSPPSPGLYMTKSHFVDDFEGWLKGNPEFEAHILGQKEQTDSLMDYQCAGENAGGPYYFNQDGKDWSGSVLLFSGTQIASYNAAHPNQNFRVLFVEDDDGPCVIRMDKNLLGDFFRALDGTYGGVTAGNDSTKEYKRGNAFQRLLAALASLIKTNDELVGNAVEDDVIGTTYPGYNWIVKGRGNVTNGWVNLIIN